MSTPNEVPTPQPIPNTPTPDPLYASQRQLVIIIYALYAAALFLGGIPAIIAIVINYVKRSEVQHPVLASHFTWQIRTFWIGLAIAIIGFITTFLFIGFFILLGVLIWDIYRLVRGVLGILDNKAMPIPAK